MAQQGQQGMGNVAVGVIAIAAVIIGAVAFWHLSFLRIRPAVLGIMKWLYYPMAVAHSPFARHVSGLIIYEPMSFWTRDTVDSLYLAWMDFYGRWIAMAGLAPLVIWSFNASKIDRYVGRLTLMALARITSKQNPYLLPCLKLDALKCPADGGVLPFPRNPLNFALQYGLLRSRMPDSDAIISIPKSACLDKYGNPKLPIRTTPKDQHPIAGYIFNEAHVDRTKTRQVMAHQLVGGFGSWAKLFSPKSTVRRMPDWARALACALYLSGTSRKDESTVLLQQLSREWEMSAPEVRGGFQWGRWPVVERSIDELVANRFDYDDPARSLATLDEWEPRALTAEDVAPGGWRHPLSVRLRVSRTLNKYEWEPRYRWTWTWKPYRRASRKRDMGFRREVQYPKDVFEELLSSTNATWIDLQEMHGYHMATWWMALMEFAQSNGSFTTSFFIWLRAMNPTLFYCMNQMGGDCGWIEAIGPWAHYRTEIVNGGAILDPMVDDAANQFAHELSNLGWLPEGKA